MPAPAVSLTWREARNALTESGRNASGAQLILDDLAHWGPGATRFSYRAGEVVRWLSYAGTGPDREPRYLSSPALRANRGRKSAACR